jgi:uncharacterized lipoprotein YajG
MKKLVYIAAALAMLTACSHSKEKAPVEPDKINEDIANAGREAALRALQYDSASQERDSALLEIRATEQRLKAEGMRNSAKSYVQGAQNVIDSLLGK